MRCSKMASRLRKQEEEGVIFLTPNGILLVIILMKTDTAVRWFFSCELVSRMHPAAARPGRRKTETIDVDTVILAIGPESKCRRKNGLSQ